jgi:hypothetical protein
MNQVSKKYTNIPIPLQDPPKFTQIWIFGLKTNHLATLVCATHEGSLKNSSYFCITGTGGVIYESAYVTNN